MKVEVVTQTAGEVRMATPAAPIADAHLRTFTFPSAPIRIVLREGDPWWVAKDVAEALGYVWNGPTAIGHVPDE